MPDVRREVPLMSGQTDYSENFFFVPKQKSDPSEIREYFKLCAKLAAAGKKQTFTKDQLGEKAIETDTIRPGPDSDGWYEEEYDDADPAFTPKKTSAKGILKLARMFGWVRYVPSESKKFRLTERGRAVSRFEGSFPDRQGGQEEREIFLEGIENWTSKSMNYTPRGREKYAHFSVRIAIPTLYFLKQYGPLSRIEVALSAITVTDERNGATLKPHIRQIEAFVNGDRTFAEGYREFGLDPTNRRETREPIERPKILLPLFEKLGLCKSRDISSYEDSVQQELEERYRTLCEGDFVRSSPKKVYELSDEGEAFVDDQIRRTKIWYEELGADRSEKAALLLLLKEDDRPIADLQTITGDLCRSINELRLTENLEFSIGDTISLQTPIAFDFFQDIPPEDCAEVRTLVEEIDGSVLEYEFAESERPIVDLSESKGIAEESDLKDVRPEPAVPLTWSENVPYNPRADHRWSEVRSRRDAIRQASDGRIVIENSKCPGVLLCAIKDPLNTISIAADGSCSIEQYDDTEVVWKHAGHTEREKITEENIEAYQKSRRELPKETIKSVVQSFSERTETWGEEPYYTLVRNFFRLLGITTDYTGKPGVYEIDLRSYEPFYASIEVKTEREGLGIDAIRQTLTDNPDEFDDDITQYRVVVGQEPSKRAKRVASDERVTILPTEYLLFAVLTEPHIQIGAEDYETLLSEVHGVVTPADMENFYSRVLDQTEEREKALEFVEGCLTE